MQRPTVAIETHGCKLNQADSNSMVKQFALAGFQPVSTSVPTDVYVVNSCTVTHIADRKARHALRAARKKNPNSLVVAAGCYPERSPDLLIAMDEVDLIVGNLDKPDLVQQVVELYGLHPGEPVNPTEFTEPYVNPTRIMIKIQEGCNQVCAYCIVPKVRGRERSVPIDDLLSKIKQALLSGYKEVVLTGTQLGSYGFDLGQSVNLYSLIHRILEETNLPRLRVSSIQPQEIDNHLLSLWSESRLCPHFHVPLQSGNNDILRLMRRRYSAGEFIDSIELIRSTVSNASITSDVIVGFPGETHDRFLDTVDLLKQIKLSDLHVFPYSVRPKTTAAHFKHQVDSYAKSIRVKKLIELSKQHAKAFRASEIGKIKTVLWETLLADKTWKGLTENYIRVHAKAEVSLNNQITKVKLIEQSEGQVVRAEVIPGP